MYVSTVAVGRNLGVTAEIRDLLPEVAVTLFAVLTQLGDPWLLGLVTAGAYVGAERVPWLDRRRAALVVAAAITALALTTALKGLFAFPRPTVEAIPFRDALPSVVGAAYVDAATATGYGFPSGHAIGSTVVWGTLALVADVWTPRRRALAVATLVGVVSFSRLVLGVHYLVDVVAGVVLGVALIAVFVGLDAVERPVRALWLALVAALAAVWFDGGVTAAAELGAAAGALVGWTLVSRADWRSATALVAGGGALVLAAVLPVVLDGSWLGALLAVGAGAGVAAAVALPVVGRGREAVRAPG
ncbi:phosphatase PAP2 family protein [Halomarina ordinaria]|uniref:Phosphatase PAP2 family protein n=1 Tax=Halomarina ordinaria TaxID=3033939 RepID=A0ABD5UCX1_9EURY|nr:phosphatase PAP2 family protein [Halomarina sp. PSRA2]